MENVKGKNIIKGDKMTLKKLMDLLQSRINSSLVDISVFDVKIDLDHCLDSEVIKIEVDYLNKEILIIKGDCGL